MKRVKSTKQFDVRQSLFIAGMLITSASSQAAVLPKILKGSLTILRATTVASLIFIAFPLPTYAASGDHCVARARYVEGKVGGLSDASLFATFVITPDRKRCSDGCKGTLRFQLSYTGKNGDIESFQPKGSLEWESTDTDDVEEVAEIVWPKCARRIGDVKTTPCTLDRGYVVRVTCEQL